MTKLEKVCAFIPAKGSSTRVKDKNKQIIRGIPMFLWAAGNLNKVLPKNQIFVHSDDEEILQIASRHGYGALKRPSALCDNNTTGDDLMLWESNQTEAEVLVQHLPPAVFLKSSTLDLLLGRVLDDGFDSSVGVYETRPYLWSDGKPSYYGESLPNSVDLPVQVNESMGTYVTSRKSLELTSRRVGGNISKVNLDFLERTDIDYPQQLEIARIIAEGLHHSSEYLSSEVWAKGQKIHKSGTPKLVIADIDGTLTNGGISVGAKDLTRSYFSRDGEGVAKLRSMGTEVIFATAGNPSRSVTERARMLGVEDVLFCHRESKFKSVSAFLDAKSLNWKDIWYVGDDSPDNICMLSAGASFSPSNASRETLDVADVVLNSQGGQGVLRELAEIIMSRKSMESSE